LPFVNTLRLLPRGRKVALVLAVDISVKASAFAREIEASPHGGNRCVLLFGEAFLIPRNLPLDASRVGQITYTIEH
jgi:hypothetical protein